VIATYPPDSRIPNRDSWRCHHYHPDQLKALECALEEVFRLASGGAFMRCNLSSECTNSDEECAWGE
jgi:hypothetical protein